MANRVVLVHTVAPLVAVFSRLVEEILCDIRPLHVLDEALLERVRQRGTLAPEDVSRLASHVALAEEIGAEAVLVTCSTVSPCVDDVRLTAHIPVLRIDEAMVAEAVRLGSHIAVLATNPTTLEPTRSMLQAESMRTNKLIETKMYLVDGAFAALMAGDGETHDRLLRAAVAEASAGSDVIVLAQASMVHVLDIIPTNERTVPLLSSPHLALLQLKRLLEH